MSVLLRLTLSTPSSVVYVDTAPPQVTVENDRPVVTPPPRRDTP